VVVKRGTCARVARAIFGQQAGAAAVIMVNSSSSFPPFDGKITENPDDGIPYNVTIPFLGVRSTDGAALVAADGGSATEFYIDPAKARDAFAGDLSDQQAALIAATQRPVAEKAFSEANGPPAWKHLPSWTVLATRDKAAGTDVVRAMAERAGATITEVEGSHVIMVSQPQAVAEVILEAVAAVAPVPVVA